MMNLDTVENVALTLMKAVASPIVIVDSNQRIIALNGLAETHLGLEQTDVGLPLIDVVHGPLMSGWLEQSPPLPDWSPQPGVFFSPHVEPLYSNGGWLLLLNDISEIRKLTRNQNEFLRLVSHDLRTPLTYILGFASMLEQQVPNPLSEKQQQYVAKIMAGIEQITKLVENIQDAGRFDPETGFYEMNRAPVDIGDIVRRIASTHVIPATKPELRMVLKVDEALPIIIADANMVERAVTNLIDNAIKYTPDGGRIEVSVTRDASNMIISVKDNGLGISPTDMERLFERHVRIHRQEFHKVKGSGLGLFIVRSVAQRHEGKAWVESELGQGSTFFFSLPLRMSQSSMV